MTTTDSPSLSESSVFTPPEAREDVDEWLADREAAIAELTTAFLRELIVGAAERYFASLTAAAPFEADGMQAAWDAWVRGELGEELGGMHRSGSLSAWLQAPGTMPPDPAKMWAAVSEQNALQYQMLATNRVVGMGPRMWTDVNRKIARGVHQGVNTETIKATIEDLTGYSEFRADTIARTETVGAYNGGEWDGARALGPYGPRFKSWLAASDRRTRPSHVEADGQTKPFEEPFDVGGVRMMRPHDMGAPAAEVVNCRCVLQLYYVGDTLPDGTVVEDPEAPDVDPLAADIAAEQDNVVRQRYLSSSDNRRMAESEAAVRRMGKRIDDEVTAALAKRGLVRPPSRAATEAAYKKAEAAKLKSFDRAALKLAKGEGFDGSDWHVWWDNLPDSDPRRTLPGLRDHLLSVDKAYNRAFYAAEDAYNLMKRGALDFHPRIYAAAYRNELRNQLARVRRMETGTARPAVGRNVYHPDQPDDTWFTGHGDTVHRNADEFYPTDWMERSREHGPLWIGDGDASRRGFAFAPSRQDRNTMIHIPRGDVDNVSLHLHEYGHRMEEVIPQIRTHEQAFLRRRAKESGEKITAPKKLSDITKNRAYGSHEVAIEDKFTNPYVGKVYGTGWTSPAEVLSMGVEGLNDGRYDFYLDEDYLHFIVGLLTAI